MEKFVCLWEKSVFFMLNWRRRWMPFHIHILTQTDDFIHQKTHKPIFFLL